MSTISVKRRSACVSGGAGFAARRDEHGDALGGIRA